MTTTKGVGVAVEGVDVVLRFGDLDVRMSAHAARAVATWLLTAADLLDGEDDEGLDEPTTSTRGDA